MSLSSYTGFKVYQPDAFITKQFLSTLEHHTDDKDMHAYLILALAANLATRQEVTNEADVGIRQIVKISDGQVIASKLKGTIRARVNVERMQGKQAMSVIVPT